MKETRHAEVCGAGELDRAGRREREGHRSASRGVSVDGAEHGGDTGELLWTLGRYDIVGFLDAPDDETAAAISMKVSGLGSVRTETLRAFTAEEVGGIIGKLG
jgi:uncharacterized protein with GYD domain